LIVDPGSVISGDGFILDGDAGNGITATRGTVTVRKSGNAFSLGPAFGAHGYTRAMRGSEPASKGEFTIYLTDFTPVNRHIEIRHVG